MQKIASGFFMSSSEPSILSIILTIDFSNLAQKIEQTELELKQERKEKHFCAGTNLYFSQEKVKKGRTWNQKKAFSDYFARKHNKAAS